MIEIAFQQGVGPKEVQLIRDRVQKECFAMKMRPKDSFILLFVVDELSCNIMEHAHASWMQLRIETSERGFSAVLKDDGVAFDTSAEVKEAKTKKVESEEGERKLGLSLIGRLVDRVSYTRSAGVNQVILEKAWSQN
jgi:anti-sigma regulatory factor (Ser/Thr protein kinase)